MQGTIKFFNATKGFGFITPTDGSKDIFVHQSEAPGPLNEGDKVEFDVGESEKGPRATNVRQVE